MTNSNEKIEEILNSNLGSNTMVYEIIMVIGSKKADEVTKTGIDRAIIA